jgi:hypothetical protein
MQMERSEGPDLRALKEMAMEISSARARLAQKTACFRKLIAKP